MNSLLGVINEFFDKVKVMDAQICVMTSYLILIISTIVTIFTSEDMNTDYLFGIGFIIVMIASAATIVIT